MLLFFSLPLIAIAAYFLWVLAGFRKDPLLAPFRAWGTPRPRRPIPELLITLSLLMLSALVLPDDKFTGLWGLAMVLCALLFALALLFFRFQELWRVLPRWYDWFLEATNEDQRRLIAYAWLRLPRETRRTLNADDAKFRNWVEDLLLTM